jgi:hypothetical protein
MTKSNFHENLFLSVPYGSISPWFITGLVDAEGSFIINIIKDDSRRLGFLVLFQFEIALNEKDKALLEMLKEYFGVGNIFYNSKDDTFRLKVSNLDQLHDIIIPHFDEYYLLTKKRSDFELFKSIINIIKNKDHLTRDGLQAIVNFKASMNSGLTDKIKNLFPNTVPANRPEFKVENIPDSNWLAGFSEGESCFFVSIYKSTKSKLGLAVQLVFKITQHSRDEELLNKIAEFLACGRVEKRSGDACDYVVNSIKEFDSKVITFFTQYPLLGLKSLNFNDFKKVFELMKTKQHLTEQGLAKIKEIKAGMNTNRGQ